MRKADENLCWSELCERLKVSTGAHVVASSEWRGRGLDDAERRLTNEASGAKEG